ncbi:MAG: histidine kinase [Bacillota bacterium]
MRKGYLVKRIILYMAVLIVLLLCVLATYAFSSYSVLSDDLRQEAASVLQVYGSTLASRLAQMDGALQNLLLQNYNELQLLKSPSETSRFYALQEIHNYITDVILNKTGVGALVVADVDYGLCVDAQASSVTYWDRYAMRRFTTDSAQRNDVPRTWQFVTINGRRYLAKLAVYNGRAAAAYTATDVFLANVPVVGNLSQTLVLTDENGVIADFQGDSLTRDQIGLSIADIPARGTQTAQYQLAEGQVLLHLRIRSVIVWNQTRILMAVSLAVIVVTLLCGALIVRYISREMVRPLNRMTEDMRRIDGGEHALRIRDEYGTQEFTQLRDTFNRLMDVIVHLKIESYEKRIALHEMELRSIRLQLKPHFFLNAITTISSLSSQSRNKEIRTYVDALSKNIRYMFKSGLHTVPIEEEIRHIGNYFEMQECKYPGCLFHFIDLPPALRGWQVPQMLVQTFVENEFKYAVSIDSVLTLLIHISKETFGGQEMLLIRIEDDGKGYPQDVLRYMNGDAPRSDDDGERVGLWSVKRMMALMYERDDLIELVNIEPHGCLNLIRVPAMPVNEYNTDPAQTP